MAGYFDEALAKGKRETAVFEALSVLDSKRNEFSAIACRGVSGICFASIIAYELGKELIVVRKSGENSHHGSGPTYSSSIILEGGYLIIDDFISSGNTLNEIVTTMKDCWPKFAPVGVYFYADSTDYTYTVTHDLYPVIKDLKRWNRTSRRDEKGRLYYRAKEES